VIYLNNPGRSDVAAAVGWIYAGLQVMHPGEQASAHRHSASAIRFIMEGLGRLYGGRRAQDDAGGQRLRADAERNMARARGRGDGSVCIWQDGLDIPFVNAMEANFYEVHPDLTQAVAYPVDDMTKTWGNPGLTPGGGAWDKGYSPMFKYEWDRTYEALSKLAGASDGSPLTGS
jgi:gentisate 1,2-dioxygenase